MPRGDLIPLSGFGRGWHVAPNGHNTRTLSRANLSLPGVGVFYYLGGSTKKKERSEKREE